MNAVVSHTGAGERCFFCYRPLVEGDKVVTWEQSHVYAEPFWTMTAHAKCAVRLGLRMLEDAERAEPNIGGYIIQVMDEYFPPRKGVPTDTDSPVS